MKVHSIGQISQACVPLVAALLIASGASAHGSKPPKSEPLVLDEEGSFFLNGETITTDYPSGGATRTPGRITIKQMYVHYRIPAGSKKKLPVIMVHGAGIPV
jgi:hypothetical protein